MSTCSLEFGPPGYAYDPPLRITFREATLENAIFRAACIAYVKPLAFGANLGLIREDRSRKALATAYGEALMVGRPPGCPDDAKPGEVALAWAEWLDSHPEEFGQIELFASTRKAFEPGGMQEIIERQQRFEERARQARRGPDGGEGEHEREAL